MSARVVADTDTSCVRIVEYLMDDEAKVHHGPNASGPSACPGRTGGDLQHSECVSKLRHQSTLWEMLRRSGSQN